MANKLKEFHDKAVAFMKGEAADVPYVPCTTPQAFAIAASAWKKDASETSEFVYYVDISVDGLTANDYVEVNFDRASQSIAAEANICPSGDTMLGKIRLYAENIPTASISGEYLITKGLTGFDTPSS